MSCWQHLLVTVLLTISNQSNFHHQPVSCLLLWEEQEQAIVSETYTEIVSETTCQLFAAVGSKPLSVSPTQKLFQRQPVDCLLLWEGQDQATVSKTYAETVSETTMGKFLRNEVRPMSIDGFSEHKLLY